ncbi:MAG: LysR family transcriptional regulator [Salinarimonas sp.]
MGNAEPSSAVRQILRSDAMRVALAVVELGSVRRAASALSMTPSAVSKQLVRIERQLGRTLFVRSRDGVRPNGEGLALASYARRFLALVAEVGERFETDFASPRVRLGVADDVGLVRLPAALAQAAAAAPDVAVELTVASSSELLALAEAGKLDLAILSDGGPPFPAAARRLRPEPMTWFGRRDATLPTGPLPLAVAAEGCPWRARALAILSAAKIPWRIVCTSPSAAGQLAAARIGLAVAPLPEAVAAGHAELAPVRACLPELPACALALLVSSRPGRAVRAVAEAVRGAYG